MLCDTTLFFSAPNLAAKAEKERKREKEKKNHSWMSVCFFKSEVKGKASALPPSLASTLSFYPHFFSLSRLPDFFYHPPTFSLYIYIQYV